LDQVLQAKQEPLSDDNEIIYKEFIDQAQKLNISKITGNEKLLSDMQQQINAIKKRISDEKKFFEEWAQFQDSLLSAKEYPLSDAAEQAYQRLIEEARNLHIEQLRIDEMHARMNEISDILFQENAKKEPEAQLSRLDELEKNVKEIKKQLGSESEQKQE
jgi:archaellum component FlaC